MGEMVQGAGETGNHFIIKPEILATMSDLKDN